MNRISAALYSKPLKSLSWDIRTVEMNFPFALFSVHTSDNVLLNKRINETEVAMGVGLELKEVHPL